MEIKVLSQENGMAEVQINLPGADLTAAIDKVYDKHKAKPDFQILRETVDSDPAARGLLQEAVQALFSGIYEDAMKQVDLPVASEPKVTVSGASEKDGAEFRLSFALRPEMKLGRYKGIHVRMPDVTVTEEEFLEALRQVESQHFMPETVERPAALGDITVIDFEGFQDGVAFAGGKGSDYSLTLGSGQFIPGFEDQLVGASAGDQVDVNVTFPEQYQAEHLAGKPALFKVTVKEVRENRLKPLSPEEQQQLREAVVQRKKDLADQSIEDQVLKVILEEAQVELPEAMVESEANICVQQFAAELSAKSMSFEQFCQQNGKTFDTVLEEMKPLARRRIQLRLVLSAIAKAENITAEDAEVEQAWEQMAMQYGLPVAQLKQYAGADTEKEIRADIVNQKAYTLLRESTILDQA